MNLQKLTSLCPPRTQHAKEQSDMISKRRRDKDDLATLFRPLPAPLETEGDMELPNESNPNPANKQGLLVLLSRLHTLLLKSHSNPPKLLTLFQKKIGAAPLPKQLNDYVW